MDELKYKRVLLKVSGEALGGEAGGAWTLMSSKGCVMW